MPVVVSEAGDCEPCDVFLRLPRGPRGDALLAGVRQNFPGARLRPWERTQAPRSSIRPRYREALVAWARNAVAGEHVAADVRKVIGARSEQVWRRMTRELRDEQSRLAARLREYGVTYQLKPHGRGVAGRFYRGEGACARDPHLVL